LSGNDYETHLVDRISVRELAAALTPRERRILCRYFRHDETLREAGQREGISPARTAQIIERSIQRMRTAAARVPLRVDPPLRARALPPPTGFDKAAFLRHMRGLVERRDAQESRALTAEREFLDRLLHDEAIPKPPPAYPLPTLPLPKPLGGTVYWPDEPTEQHVEPWFDLSRTPSLGDLRCIAQYALGYFVAACRPSRAGLQTIGKTTTRVVCPRTADMVAAALQAVKREIPATAQLSACLLDLPEELLAVVLGCPFVALRLASVEDGKKVSIEVTWDE